jgi:hypothetical protein
MDGTLAAVLTVALLQGILLRGLHQLARSNPGLWSELSFLLPAYACTVGVPLTYYLLAPRSAGKRSRSGCSWWAWGLPARPPT